MNRVAELQTLLSEHVEAVRLVVDELRNIMADAPILTEMFGPPAVMVSDGERTAVITAEQVLYGCPAVTTEGLNLKAVDADDVRLDSLLPAVNLVVRLADIVAETPYDGLTHVTLYHTVEVRVWNMMTGDDMTNQLVYLTQPITWRGSAARVATQEHTGTEVGLE